MLKCKGSTVPDDIIPPPNATVVHRAVPLANVAVMLLSMTFAGIVRIGTIRSAPKKQRYAEIEKPCNCTTRRSMAAR